MVQMHFQHSESALWAAAAGNTLLYGESVLWSAREQNTPSITESALWANGGRSTLSLMESVLHGGATTGLPCVVHTAVGRTPLPRGVHRSATCSLLLCFTSFFLPMGSRGGRGRPARLAASWWRKHRPPGLRGRVALGRRCGRAGGVAAALRPRG